MHRPLPIVCALAAAALLGAAMAPARANGSGTSASVNGLKSSSGGTGLSKGGGTGGTGIPATANAPGGSIRPTFKPAHATAPPPAGVRPHTDLAAAEKRTSLSSAALLKRTSLYPARPPLPGDPPLSPPVLNKIGATTESARSFKSLPWIAGSLSKGEVYPTNGGTHGAERPHASLSSPGSGGTAAMSAMFDDDDTAQPRKRGGLLSWLGILLASLATTGIAAWLWAAAPKSARMRLPATV